MGSLYDAMYGDDEKKKKASQQASTEQKNKQADQQVTSRTTGHSLYDAMYPVQKPAEPPAPEKKPSLFERAKQKVTDLFSKKKEPTVEIIDKNGNVKSTTQEDQQPQIQPLPKVDEPSYLKFPSIFPNPDISPIQSLEPDLGAAPEATSARLTPAAADASIKFWSAPVDNSLNAMRDFLTYHPKLLETLGKAQQIVEETPYIGLKKSQFTQSVTSGVAKTILGSSQQIQDTFNTRLPQSLENPNETVKTVGEVIGGVLPYVAGGSLLKAAGAAKATLPILFTTLGQTSAAPGTTLEQRLYKAPIDAVAGWLFSYLPLPQGMKGLELIKTLGKGAAGAGSVTGGQAFFNYLVEGLSPEEAAKVAAQQALVGSLFYVAGTSMNLLTAEIFNSKYKAGKGVFTPDQVKEIVRTSNLEGSKMGNDLVKAANEAATTGKNLEINMEAMKKSFVSSKLNLDKPEGINLGITPVDAPPGISPTDPIANQNVPALITKGGAGEVGKPTAPVAPVTPPAPEGLDKAIAQYKSDQGVTISPDKKVNVSPALQELTKLSETPAVVESTQQQVASLPKNEDGTITLYRVGTVRPEDTRLVSASYTKEAAVAFNELHKADMGDRPITEIKVKPEQIKVFIGGTEAEVLIQQPKQIVKTEETTKPKQDTIKNIPKELQPIAKQVGEYTSVEEFSQALKNGIELKDESLPDNLQSARGDLIAARRSGSVGDIEKINKEIQNILIKLNEVARTSSPFIYRLADNGKISVSGYNATELSKGIYEPTILGKKISEIKPGEIDSMIKELKEKSTLPNKSMDEIVAKEQINILREIKSNATPVQDFYNKVSGKPPKIDEPVLRVQEVKKKPVDKQTSIFAQAGEGGLTKEGQAKFSQKQIAEARAKVQAKLSGGESGLEGTPLGASVPTPIEQAAKKPTLVITPPKKVPAPKKPKLKESTFTKVERAEIQKKTKDTIFSGETQWEAAQNIESYFTEVTKKPKTTADIQKLKAIRAEANRNMFEVVGANTGDWKKDYAFFMQLRNDESLSPIVDAIEMGIANIDDMLVEAGAPATKTPSGYGDPGGYADAASIEAQLKNIKAIELPELVRIAKAITGQEPGLKSFRRALGMFYGMSNGIIKLDPEIFNDPVLTAKVLAHEMGHMTDYFDDKTLKRGNIVGRVASLNHHLAKMFGEPLYDGKQALDKSELMKELKALTQWWKPFNEAANKSYTSYRYSSKELYADAISVLFNDPDALKARAPKFWAGFFDYIDKKPTIAKNFYEIWDLVNKGEGEVLDLRAKEVREMFDKGEDKILAMVKEKRTREKDYVFRLKYELIDRNQKIIDKVNEAKKAGKPVSDDENPIYYLEENNYVGGLVKNWVEENIQPIYETLRNNDLTWEDLGEVLFHERVINERGAVNNPIGKIRELTPDMYESIKEDLPDGIEKRGASVQLKWLKKKYGGLVDADGNSFYDQLVAPLPKGLANPLGYDAQTSQKQLDYLKSQLGDRYKILDEQLPKYREAIKGVLKQAEEAGFYKPELLKQMQANPAYATFQVLDYLDLNIPASIKQQRGTLKEIANPATSTVVKTISTIRAIERNKSKRAIVDFMKKNFTDEIQPARMAWTGKSQVPLEPKDPDLALFTVIEDGKFTGYYVDPYIADTMQHMSTGKANAVIETFKWFNNKKNRPLFITYNLGFQSFNLFRDFFRFYKNTPGMTFTKALRRYGQAVKPAAHRAWGITDEVIKEMEKSKILSVTYNDIVQGMTDEDKQIDMVIAKAGLSPLKGTKTNILIKPFKAMLDGIESLGNLIETIPKVAGYKELNGKLPPKELGSFIRSSVGSPDFLRRGNGYGWYNEVFLFANAIKEGIRADYNVAFKNPRTRAGFWWKTIITGFLPKIAMYTALLGLFGASIKKMMNDVSEYDMTNYTIIPLGEDNGQTVYLRVPQDETGRLISGLFWKFLRAGNNNRPIAQDAADVLSYAGGQAPGLSPDITTLLAIGQFMAGKNPYDSFRGRNVIPDQEFKAGGKYALKPFITWAINQSGGGTFFKSYYSTQPASSKSWLQKTLDFPVVSNILGRWIKVSDYGQQEKNQSILDKVEAQEATRRIEERNTINDAIKEYKSGSMTIDRRVEIEKRLVEEIVGEAPYSGDRKTKATNTIKKFKVGILKGEVDPVVDSVIYSNTNEQKLSILKEARQTMDADKFRDIVNQMHDEKIISDDVLKELKASADEVSAVTPNFFEGLNVFNPPKASAAELSPQEVIKNAPLDKNGRKGMYSSNYREDVIFPYDIRGSDKEGYVKFYYPSGAYSEIKKEQLPKYQALTQLYFKDFGVGDYPKYAPDWSKSVKLEPRYYQDVGQQPPAKKVLPSSKQTTPYDKEIKAAFGGLTTEAQRVLRYTDETGAVHGENVGFQVGREIDTENRIDPKTGKYDSKAPIKQVKNPFTGKKENSIDRGLFRVNNGTFYMLLNSKPYREQMLKAGIVDTMDVSKIDDQKAWDEILDPAKNAKMARIIYNFHKDTGGNGWSGWFAAPPDLRNR